MQLILLEKVKNLGSLGETVIVKPGYGRNYLIPQGKAIPATGTNLADFEKRRAGIEAHAQGHLDGALSRKQALDGQSISIDVHASPEGKLFGSVGQRDIAELFSARGLAVNKGEVVLAEGPLRMVGEYEITIALHTDVNALVKVLVQAV